MTSVYLFFHKLLAGVNVLKFEEKDLFLNLKECCNYFVLKYLCVLINNLTVKIFYNMLLPQCS